MNKIKELRKIKRINQEDLCNILNVTRQNISRYENGIIPLTESTILLLADYFNVTTDYLLGRSDEIDKVQSLLTSYQKLNESDRKLIDDMISRMLEAYVK
jgi:transcriptional regulator with XRE-family HTH domain